MKYYSSAVGNVDIIVSSFIKNETHELHAIIKTKSTTKVEEQLEEIVSGFSEYLSNCNIPLSSLVFARCFVSDIANQENLLGNFKSKTMDIFANSALSFVEQPPLSENKIVVWAYVVHCKSDINAVQKYSNGNELVLKRNGYEHIWNTGLITDNTDTDSFSQTSDILHKFSDSLNHKGYSLLNNCIRTWLFVKDIDYNYGGLVDARREIFKKHNMTPETHFIASTGIEGRQVDAQINVCMDAYSVGGIQQQQVNFLEARQYLNPTHEYGVTFERGTSVDYGDRKHIFISGTASIDKDGNIVHVGDVAKQVKRATENIQALLTDADSSMDDIAQMIIYLRDISDTQTINHYFTQNYSHIPKVVVLASVCRPGWLVEIECIAIKSISNSHFSNF